MPWVDHRSGGQFLSQKKWVKLLLYPYRNLNTWGMIGRIKKKDPIGETRGPNLQKTELSSKVLHSKNRSIICADVKIAVPKGDGGRGGLAKVEDDFKPAQGVSVRLHHSELASICGMAWAGSKNDQKKGTSMR